MFGLKSVLVLALCAISASAAPSGNPNGEMLDKRQWARVKCGSNTYTATQLGAAKDEGCRLFNRRQAIGRNNYPHAFGNRERLALSQVGPYQEFPIMSNGRLYAGGAPGADRVVFTTAANGVCTYVGAMTHTGAAGNQFVLCR